MRYADREDYKELLAWCRTYDERARVSLAAGHGSKSWVVNAVVPRLGLATKVRARSVDDAFAAAGAALRECVR